MLRDVLVTAVLNDQPSSAAIPAIIHDVSATGACVSCARKFKPGDRLRIALAQSGSHVQTVDGVVVHGYQVTDGWWATGIRFLWPTPPPHDLID